MIDDNRRQGAKQYWPPTLGHFKQVQNTIEILSLFIDGLKLKGLILDETATSSTALSTGVVFSRQTTKIKMSRREIGDYIGGGLIRRDETVLRDRTAGAVTFACPSFRQHNLSVALRAAE